MAKNDELDFGSDFENWDSDLDDLNFGDTTIGDSSQNRSPVEKVRTGITSGLKSTTKGVGDKLTDRIQREMPKVTSAVGEAMTFSSDAMALRDQFVKQATPTINELKKAGRILAPKLKGYLPNSLQQRLENALKGAETTKAPSVEESHNAAIQGQLESIFAIQEKREQAKDNEERTDKFVDRTISSVRHQELTKVVDAIRVATEFQKTFASTISVGYMKKSLELKYKHLFVAQDMLATVQGLAKLTEVKLDQIRHNTALPDTQKQLFTETYKDIAKTAIAQRINTSVRGWGKQILSNVHDKVLSPILEGLELASMAATTAADFSEMQDEMGMAPEGLAPKVGGIAGAIASNKIVQKISGKLFGTGLGRGLLTPYSRGANNIMDNAKLKLMLKAQELADSEDESGFKQFFYDIISPNMRSGAGIIEHKNSDPWHPASFDNASRTSIVEIIPGFLAKILQQTTKMATGRDEEELTYSYDSRDFVSVSEFRQGVMKKAFGSKDTNAKMIGSAVGAVRGAFSARSDDVPTFDRLEGEVRKVLINCAMGKVLLYPKRIKAYNEGEDLSEKHETYIQKIFKGIEHPKEVAQLLEVTLFANDGQVNKIAQAEIDRYVISMMTNDQYLETLPKYFIQSGQSRHLQDIAKFNGRDFDINEQYVRSFYDDPETAEYVKSLNSTTRSTRKYLENDREERENSHALLQKYLDKFFGNGADFEKLTVAGRQFSGMDDFFRKMYDAVAVLDQTPDFVAGTTGQTSSTPETKGTVDARRTRVRSPRVKGGLETQTQAINPEVILAGTDIILPVHIKSSEVAFKLDEKAAAAIKASAPTPTPAPKAPTITGDLGSVMRDHATRQHPVPDLLERIATATEEMNDKSLTMLGSVGRVFGKIYHRGKEIKDNFWNSIKEFRIPTSLTGAWDSAKGQWARTKGARDWVGERMGSTRAYLKDKALAAGTFIKDMPGRVIGGALGTWDAIKEMYNNTSGQREGIRATLARYRTNLGNMAQNMRDKMSPRFVDVYLKDQVKPGEPLLSVRQQREGVVFSDGKEVTTSYLIDRPVMDPKTEQTLITQENIDHGLVDVRNRPLKMASSKPGRLLTKFFGLGDKLGRIKDMFTKDNSIAGLLNTLAGGAFGALKWAKNGIASGARSLYDKFTGKVGEFSERIRVKDLKELVGDKLDAIYNYMVSRFGSVIGHEGGSGSGSTQYDQYQQKQKEQEQELQKDFQEQQLETLEKIERNQDALLDVELREAKLLAAQADASGGGGGIMDSITDIFGEGGIGKWGKKKLGSLKNWAGKTRIGTWAKNLYSAGSKTGLGRALGMGGDLLLGAGRGIFNTAGNLASNTLGMGNAVPWSQIFSKIPSLAGAGAELASGAGLATEIVGGAGLAAEGAGLVGAGAAAAETAAAGTAAASGIGTGLAGISSAVGSAASAISSGGGALAAALASNPIGWGVAGALAVGLAAYGTYKWLNPSGDDFIKARADAYGVDLSKSTGFFSSSYTKRLIELEEETVEVLMGEESPFDDNKLVSWAKRFDFDPKETEQVKYFATWYRQRFYPAFRIFLDLVMKAGVKYDDVDDLSDEAKTAVLNEFDKQTQSSVNSYKDMTPDMAGFEKFQKAYLDVKKDRSEGKMMTGAEVAAAKTAIDSNTATKNSKTYAPDVAAAQAALRMNSEPVSSTSSVIAAASNPTMPGQPNPNYTVGGNSATQATVGIGTDLDISKYKPVLPKSDELGALSAKYESGGNSMAIGYDGPGGTSYGMFQIASGTGTFNSFLKWLVRQGPEGVAIADRLAKAGPANTGSRQGAVPTEWKKLVLEGKLPAFEKAFIKETHYDEAMRGLGARPGLKEMVQSSKALQDVLWSTAVHLGPGWAKDVFVNGWDKLTEKTPEALIKQVYTLRGGYFKKQPPDTQATLRKRFGEEASIAIAMLGKEKSSGSETTAVAADSTTVKPDGTTVANADTSMTRGGISIRQEGPNLYSVSTPKVKSSAETGTDMAPASVAQRAPSSAPATTTSPVSTAAAAAPVSVAQASVQAPSVKDGAAVDQLTLLNTGIAQVNMTLQAMLAGQGIWVDIRDNIVGIGKGAGVQQVSADDTTTRSGTSKVPVTSLPTPKSSISLSRSRQSVI